MVSRDGFSQPLSSLVERIESCADLDRISTFLQPLPRFWRRNTQVKNVLSGSFLGHPLNPLLTDLPIGCWSSAALLDFVAAGPLNRGASRSLVGFGILFAAPTALAGASDWLDTADAEQRVGLVHALGNLVGLGLITASWFQRGGERRDQAVQPRARLSMIAGLATISASGWLGGHLSYAMGVGVDTNSFISAR
jgi:uncharacterized membrane protein